MPAGRPCELTPDLIVKAHALASEVGYVETAAALLGISKDTLYRWLRLGSRERRRRDRGLKPRPKDDLLVQFSDAFKKGLAEGEKRHLDTIRKASAQHWQASAWILERSRPERWSLDRNELRRLKKQVRRLLELRNIDPDTGETRDKT